VISIKNFLQNGKKSDPDHLFRFRLLDTAA